MRRKQGTSHLDPRQIVMLENAFYMVRRAMGGNNSSLRPYQCNPPERVFRETVELSPMQSFIQHLLHDVLMKRTLDKVLKLLRKLHWEDQEVCWSFYLKFLFIKLRYTITFWLPLPRYGRSSLVIFPLSLHWYTTCSDTISNSVSLF
jgi:hypothetical protein